MESKWVDFKVIKDRVSMQAVLDHYGLSKTLKRSGSERRGRCPIHQGDGKDTFHANTQKNAFQCFSCKARGNVLDFVAAMEKCSVREAAIKLKDWFSVSIAQAPERRVGDETARLAHTVESAKLAPERTGESAESNRPLGFQLKGIDPTHPYIAERGIARETAERFGIGFFPGKGSMAGRVVIPIHNETGELVAYAGRAIDDSEPKYKLPAGFHKTQELFNLHRLLEEGRQELEEEGSLATVYLVEGFFDCMKVEQADYPAVALMGCSLSLPQEEFLARYFESVVILLDGDEAGTAAAEEISNQLKHRLFVRVVATPEGKQPDLLSSEELNNLLG